MSFSYLCGNKMENLLKHIAYLVEHHDCVTIPGIGAFIARENHARYDEVNGILYPPIREISFNGDITFDDGLIVTSYARQRCVNYTTALESVRCDTAILSDVLSIGGGVFIPSVGRLQKNLQGVFSFTPVDDHTNCLSPINVKTLYCKTETSTQEIVLLPAPSRFNKVLHKVMKYAAMLIFMISISIVFSTPIIDVCDYSVVKADMCPFNNSVEVSTEVDTVPEFLIAAPADNEFVNSENLQLSDIDILCSHSYVLIIASLPTEALAEQFMKEAGDDAKGIIASGGRYRVYGETGDFPAELMKSSLLSRYPDAWTMATDRN